MGKCVFNCICTSKVSKFRKCKQIQLLGFCLPRVKGVHCIFLVPFVSVLFNENLGCVPAIWSFLQSSSHPDSFQILLKSFLLFFPPTLKHSPPQKLCSFEQLLVFVPIHLAPSYLQNILAFDGCGGTHLIFNYGSTDGWQHLLFQQPSVLLWRNRLQCWRERIAKGEPALQRTDRKLAWYKSFIKFWLKLDPSWSSSVVSCCCIVFMFLLQQRAAGGGKALHTSIQIVLMGLE